MKNVFKKVTLMILTLCLLTAGIAYNPTTASAAEYKKSVSKKVTVKSGDNINQFLIINVKEDTEVTVTVKATDKKSKDFGFSHGSYCSYCMQHENEFGDDSEMAFGESGGKKSAKLISMEKGSSKIKLRKGKHIIDFHSTSDKTQKLKITIKADKAVLKISKWKVEKF